MLDLIKFSEELSIYTTKISDIDNEQLSKDLELNCDISKNLMKGNGIPGIQSDIIITSKNIQNLEIKIIKIIKDFLKLKDDYLIYKWYWTYISDSNNTLSLYHNHVTDYNIEHSREIPQWSLVYYASFPNNLEANDGLLLFQTKSGEEFSILPEEGQIIMFPSDVLHKPGLNKNSTKKRIVFAANVAILDTNKKYSKKQKSLI
jgi:hypothetical protein